MDFNDTYQHLSPIGRFNQPTPGEFSSGVLSVIVGRGPVGLCAKTGAYRVVRSPQSVYDQMENEPAAVSLVVLPLIYNYRVVGVLQLTSTNAMHLDEAMLNSTLHVDSSLSPAGSPSRASMQPIHMNPFHLQIHEMCIEIGIDLAASLKLSVVVTSLAHSIDLYERSAELRLQEEQREVSREQETEELVAERDKALGRVEHLERSRLRHFKQSRRLREEAILWRKRCIEVKQSLEEYMEQVEAYDSQSREVEALHRAMREATTQVFGADEGQWTNAYTSSEYIDTTEYNYAPDADTLMMRTARSGVSSNSAPSESQFIDRSRAANSTVMFTPSLPDEGVSHTNPSRGGAGRRGR
ncbi:unnamed protein product [Symbiodinium microadriaticum]|nr:unnamed protein product [Symbiodinium microadriaticum]